MKNLITLSLIGLICLSLVNCATFKEEFKLEKAPQLINAVVPSAVKIGVAKQPKSEPYLSALVTVINGFALGQELTPKALEQAIKAAKIKELETPEALAVTQSVVALYKAYYDSAVTKQIAEVKHLVPILEALSDAITKGLDQ